MKRNKNILLCGLAAVMLLGGCSAQSSSTAPMMQSAATAAPAPQANMDYGMIMKDSMEWNFESDAAGGWSEPSPDYKTSSDNTSLAMQNVARKIIYNGYIAMRTTAYDNTVLDLKTLVFTAGGFIEQSNSSVYMTDNGREYKRGNYTLRVPVDTYDSVKASIEALGQVSSSSDTSQDATAEYYDTESRLNSLRAQEKSVLGMIEKAAKIDDLILLEQRLSEIRTDIELQQSRLNTIDRQASFSSITVDVTEVRVLEPIHLEPASTWEKIQNAFIGSINGVIAFCEGFIVFTATAIVPLALIGVLILVAWFIIRRTARMHRGKQAGNIQTAERNEKNG